MFVEDTKSACDHFDEILNERIVETKRRLVAVLLFFGIAFVALGVILLMIF